MIGKFYNVTAVVCMATVLAVGGFAGYLFGTGRLSADRVRAIAGVLRGETPAPAPQPESAPAPASAPVAESRAPSAEELQAQRKQDYLERLRLERAAADMEAQRRLLDQVLQHVVSEQERLAADKTNFAAQRKQITETARDEGFKKELEYVSGLQPRQAKEHIVRVWRKQKADAVRLFMALEVNRGKRILEQFKTPEELQIQTDLLEQVRLQGLEGYAETSGKTAGAAP